MNHHSIFPQTSEKAFFHQTAINCSFQRLTARTIETFRTTKRTELPESNNDKLLRQSGTSDENNDRSFGEPPVKSTDKIEAFEHSFDRNFPEFPSYGKTRHRHQRAARVGVGSLLRAGLILLRSMKLVNTDPMRPLFRPSITRESPGVLRSNQNSQFSNVELWVLVLFDYEQVSFFVSLLCHMLSCNFPLDFVCLGP